MNFRTHHDLALCSYSAGALDNQLTAIRRDHEQRSQVVERKIWYDAAYEEAKRREKDLHGRKLQEDRAKAVAEVSFVRPYCFGNLLLALLCFNICMKLKDSKHYDITENGRYFKHELDHMFPSVIQ